MGSPRGARWVFVAVGFIVACGGGSKPTESSPRKVSEPAAAEGRVAKPEDASPRPVPSGRTSRVEPSAAPCDTPPPAMACIAGGPFARGSDTGPENARPAAPVWLSTFHMDVDEVTVEAYEACVSAGGCPMAGPRYEDFDRPRQPINGVSWHDAVAFCRAQGKHLPSEAEWEKAARGTDGRLYAWGDEPATCERAVIKDASGRGCGVEKAGRRPETGRVWEVGSRPPGVYGLRDMSGNSWEWVADWASASYGECGASCEGKDPRGPCGGKDPCAGHKRRVVRGGSWYWDASYATAFYRRFHVPSNRPFHHFGFRCAASVEEARRLMEDGVDG